MADLPTGGIPDEWEFYPCLVDDAPASILLNMWYRGHYEEVGVETLYYGRIEMNDPDEHGMGTSDEASILFAAEDQITVQLGGQGLLHVGRLRNTGGWQLTFYGPAGKEEDLEAAFDAALTDRDFSIGSQPDAEWSYYHDFLFPDRERLQWIANRRQVQTLEENGDNLEASRAVEHFLYFSTPESRGQFIASLEVNGFPTSHELEHSGDPGDSYGVQVVRDDMVELSHIHDVVMDLAILAEKFGGDYDGWGALVVGRESDPNFN